MTDKSLVAWRNTPCTFSIFLLYEASFYILPPLPLKNNISICSYNAHRGEEGRKERRRIRSEKNKYKITFPFRKMERRIYKTAQVTSTKSHGLTSYIRQLDPEMFIKAQHCGVYITINWIISITNYFCDWTSFSRLDLYDCDIDWDMSNQSFGITVAVHPRNYQIKRGGMYRRRFRWSRKTQVYNCGCRRTADFNRTNCGHWRHQI